MRNVTLYLLVLLVVEAILIILPHSTHTTTLMVKHQVLLYSIMIGGIGGILHCLRSIYLHACVEKNWDNEWLPWYFIRPIASLISGGIAYLFIKAGLIVLEADQSTEPTNFAIYALSFVAGYNVDRFLAKIDEISEAVFGIKRK